MEPTKPGLITFGARGVRPFLATLALLLAVTLGGGSANAKIDQRIYASLIMDEQTGVVLHDVNGDKLRHPASLTKIMTLYMMFDAIERGRFTPTDRLKVSSNASRKPASKLGLRSGSTITVRNAIRSLITKSANDAATVIAEALAGSESRFAEQMTRKARELGMRQTVFRNASGLPDKRQVTTAYDMAKLAIAMRRDFPGYYYLFSMKTFRYNGRTHRNHNKLLSRYSGTDGLKTGYINASRFNLVATVERGGRRLIGVVFGGRPGGWRDNHMIKLLNQGYSKLRTLRVADHLPPLPVARPSWVTDRAIAAAQPVTQPSADGPIKTASAVPLPTVRATARPEPGEGVDGVGSIDDHSDWGIQVGAYSTEARANVSVRVARSQLPDLLGEAENRIEKLNRQAGAIFRARLFGLTEEEARAACLTLKRNRLACVPVPGPRT